MVNPLRWFLSNQPFRYSKFWMINCYENKKIISARAVASVNIGNLIN